MQRYQVLLYYKYVHIADPEELKTKQRALCEALGLKGRIIVATEGINGTVEGTYENTERYVKEMIKDARFSDMNWKKSIGSGHVFPKLSVKNRKEIVSLHLEDAGFCEIDPNRTTGKHLKAEDLHSWIVENKVAKQAGLPEPKEFYIIDMRNAYEFKVGYFEDSILPPLDNFRDLPKYLETISHLKNKTVVTVCTGGVRCEKASGFLISQGFTDVYQLENGIVTYMEKYPNEDFLGKLYVFDERIAMGFHTDDPKHQIVGKCDMCGLQSERYVNCANDVCHRHFVACDACVAEGGGSVKCKEGCITSRHGESLKDSGVVLV
ncbi:MAG: rhodanese-related sulfurtransferase [Candidatus Paceibacterota bacterium]